MVFGRDFQYQQAEFNYKNMDAMIHYMNKNYGDKYFFRYSTPSDYVNAIKKAEMCSNKHPGVLAQW